MLCIDEVGVDLELCVHAHGNDVDRLGSFLQIIVHLILFNLLIFGPELLLLIP